MSPKTEFFTCARILSLMALLLFIFQYMLRVNISIAIVDMVAKNTTKSSSETRFNWTEQEKNQILGCYFWGYLISAIPGGRLSETYGPKLVLGCSMLLGSILTLLVPVVCRGHYYWVLVLRTVTGLALGVVWPSLPPLVVRWVPPTERSKFMSHAAACSLGTALTLLLSGFLIAKFGWPSVYYVTGTIALVWALAWFYLVYDTPNRHPRISKEEKEELEARNTFENLEQNRKTPWAKILTSGPVWAIIVANTGTLFTFFLVLNELPSYMDQVLHFDIEENGLLSSLPYFATYSAAVLSCYWADKWHKSRKFSVVAIRKFFTSLSLLGPCVLFLVQSFWGYDRIVSTLVFSISLGFLGCFVSGFYSNCMDIAPAYSGTIYGLANTGGSLVGYLGTELVTFFTKEEQNFEQWKYVFWVLVAVDLFGAIFYLFFASGELQEWNPRSQEH